ncbi:hypothetical protein P153DRAFT_342647 [Dothidotthia symphoricarpi CBS 119687]|uniref:HPP transmembrane region domain-containing protein n=1 Tax=Dothidotthia symphoricarpi CBS 119687 TaxID=1392245 RepID=A0A6A6ACF2_9PLEO|nr:uncharacterized protein P153DRAFT_342647 [Dothidotthia symphoricarpi CBS 119687]KAF2128664.1 hypothetical protein P153DRAFT_342647 [Dothidotthia symphoricarpi CBS 119687]
MSFLSGAGTWHLDIDRYINRVVPQSPLHKLPTPVSRFLGYRKEQRQDVGNICGVLWSLLGAICGLSLVAAVFNNTESIQMHHPPALIASFGASAILEYNTIRSPLGQPRNALLGHTLSALVGIGISKLFQFHSDYESIKWMAGAVACGCASATMLLTGTVHPPGGASAVLAVTEPAFTAMGWYFAGLILWGTTLMLVVALIINNIQRQFPLYWWTSMDLKKAKEHDPETLPDARGGLEKKKTVEQQRYGVNGESIEISGAEIVIPDDLSLNKEEVEILEKLRERLRKRTDGRALNEEERESDKMDSNSIRSSAEFTIVASRSQEVQRNGSGSTL